MFDYTESFNKCVEYFEGDELAAKVFLDKYALKNENGELMEETPVDMHKRLAKEFARIENKYINPLSEEKIFSYFDKFKYIVPQGSPMSSIGNNYSIQSTSNCFVIESPYDSYSGILKTDQEQAQIMKRRGGVGFDISTIRPKGVKTQNAAKTTDGIGVFMERFSNTTREVAQGGRRGALMMTLSVHHPEIETFINIKRDKTKVTGANISVKLSDEFMNAVKNDTTYIQKWPVDSNTPSIVKEVSARLIWNQIIDSAWESAEPGVLFWDTVKRYTPTDCYEKFGYGSISTNPCGEVVLSQNYDSCRLITINLLNFVKNPFTDKAKFDYKLYDQTIIDAQRLMDDMIDIELEKVNTILEKIKNDPEPDDVKKIEFDLWNKVKNAAINGRRTGLGITALGDTLAALGIIYGSDDSIKVTEKIYKHLAVNSYKSSCIMAKERGCFPIFDHSLELEHPFITNVITQDSELLDLYNKYGRRNIANTTTAPTGSVSILTQTSSGIEPVFMVKYNRRKKIMGDENIKPDFVDSLGDKWVEYTVYHKQYKKWMEINNKQTVEESPYYKALANDIDWISGVKIQSVAQKWIDHSISRTCNLPNSATKEQVNDIYISAWEHKCKGFTVYRDGCRDGVLINTNSNSDRKTNKIVKTTAPKRPKEMICDIHHTKITKKLDKPRSFEYAVLVGLIDDDPYEIFVFENGKLDKKYTKAKLVKKSRGHYNLHLDDTTVVENIMADQTEEEEMITRLASTALRHGADISFLVHQLEKVKGSNIGSFTKVMSRILKKYIKDGTKVSGETCSSCGSTNIIRKEGCLTCVDCGNSKCG